jgi:hypothetical protein
LAILRSPEAAKVWVAQLKATLTPPLFASPEQQLRNAHEWWGHFFHLAQLREAEDQMSKLVPSTEPLVAWVLTPHFNTVEQTFDWLWELAARIHPSNYRSENVKSDPEHLRMLDEIEFTPNSLTWELIDFGAHLCVRPDEVSNSDSAEFALLAAVSHHTVWATSLGETVNGIFVPYVNLCGIRVRLLESDFWAHVPGLDRSRNRLNLSAYPTVQPDPTWGCPVRIQRGSSS